MNQSDKKALLATFLDERAQRHAEAKKIIKEIECGKGRWIESIKTFLTGIALLLIASPIAAYLAIAKRNEPEQPWHLKHPQPVSDEMLAAIDRSLKHRLITESPTFPSPPYLEDAKLRAEIAAVCMAFVPSLLVGQCLIVASSCIEYVKERLECKAWITLGWISDSGTPLWIMDPEELCALLKEMVPFKAEYHAWITLDSGEIIDPTVFPTLSYINSKYSHGAGVCNILSPSGSAYREVPGLPVFQYHPSVITL